MQPGDRRRHTGADVSRQAHRLLVCGWVQVLGSHHEHDGHSRGHRHQGVGKVRLRQHEAERRALHACKGKDISVASVLFISGRIEGGPVAWTWKEARQLSHHSLTGQTPMWHVCTCHLAAVPPPTCLNGDGAGGLLVEAQQLAQPVAHAEGEGVQQRHWRRQLRPHGPAPHRCTRSGPPKHIHGTAN